MVRGIAKKSFMSGKRAKLDVNSTIDIIIKDLEENSKLDDNTKNSFLVFKADSSDAEDKSDIKAEKSNTKEEAASLFDIKLLNWLYS